METIDKLFDEFNKRLDEFEKTLNARPYIRWGRGANSNPTCAPTRPNRKYMKIIHSVPVLSKGE